MKPMTHVGKITAFGRLPKWVTIRETPKFWTNQYYRWRKRKQDGTLDLNPRSSSNTGYRTRLDISSIRPFTVEEKLKPLVDNALGAEEWWERCCAALPKARVALDKTKVTVEKAETALKVVQENVVISLERIKETAEDLAKFKKKHNLA